MTVLAKLELSVQADKIEEMKRFLAEILPDTRTYPGNEGTGDAFQGQDDPNRIVIVELWNARDDHQKYLGWREETGVLGTLAGMLTGPPDIQYFDKLDT